MSSASKTKWRKEHPEQARAFQRKWREEHLEQARAIDRKSYRAHAGETKDRIRKYRLANPDKTRAHWMLTDAIRHGKLQRQPCEICGNPRSHAHHDDYSKPFKVRWFCALHHSLYHEFLHETRQHLSKSR